MRKVKRIFRGFTRMLWQSLVPFNSRPEEPPTLPEPKGEVTDQQVEQCQWIFDQAEDRRASVEQKAQSTFTITIFLVPLLASIFVFLVHSSASDASGRTLGIVFLFVSGCLLLLGFISIVRAVSIKFRETLFFGAVVDADGQFREYDRGFRARGLLRCAAMNTAMNDHIAQFVKGAQVLTACSVAALLSAAVPAAITFSHSPSVTRTTVTGPIEVTSGQVAAFSDEVAKLREALTTLAARSGAEDTIKSLDMRLTKIEAELRDLQKPVQNSTKKK